MGVRKIQMGQVWRHDESGENYLVTKLYSEVFSTYAMLRKVDGTPEDVMRVKIAKQADSMELPGFTYTQESQDF